MRAVVHFVGMVRTCDDALTARDTSFGQVAKFGFRVLAFGIVAPEATHGASFEEHSCADARTIVQGEALNVENNVSSVHCDTVRWESIANDAAVVMCAECVGRSALFFRPAPRWLIVCLLGDFSLRFKAGRKGRGRSFWRNPATECGSIYGARSDSWHSWICKHQDIRTGGPSWIGQQRGQRMNRSVCRCHSKSLIWNSFSRGRI
jgi:hypothetical protein